MPSHTCPPAELMSHSGAGPLDAGMAGSPWVEMQQEAAAREDEDETKPAGDHRSGSLPNRRNGFAALDLLNPQLAQKGSHLLYTTRMLRSAMRDLMNSVFFNTPYLFHLEALIGSHEREMEK